MAGTALSEPPRVEFVAGTALCESPGAEFVAGTALCELRGSNSWQAQYFAKFHG